MIIDRSSEEVKWDRERERERGKTDGGGHERAEQGRGETDGDDNERGDGDRRV